MADENVTSFGNQLNSIVQEAKSLLFAQGELAQLSYTAFDQAVAAIQNDENDEFDVSYPIGYRPNRQPMTTSHKYPKDNLIQRYVFLANTQLAINGTYQLITIIEAMLSDLIRAIALKFPHKLGAKRNISFGVVLKAKSIEEIHIQAVDIVLNELSYKSPRDFAQAINEIFSINFLECPAYNRYIEVKATRDIYVHNRGVANDVYVAKAGSHARIRAGEFLPIDTVYFLESYECCLQFTEWLEPQLHEHWHSDSYESSKQKTNSTSAPSSV